MRYAAWLRRIVCYGAVGAVLSVSVLIADDDPPNGDTAPSAREQKEEKKERRRIVVPRYRLDMPPAARVSPELNDQLDLKGEGVVIEHVVPEGPAAKAGIQRHDIVVAVDDQPITSVHDLIEATNKSEGKELSVKLLHAGKPVTVAVTPSKHEGGAYWATDGVDMQEVERLIRDKLRMAGGDARLELFRPGKIFPPGAFRLKGPEFPDDLTVTIRKQGKAPAEVEVKKGDKTWNVKEGDLDELPDDVRPNVEALMGRGPFPFAVRFSGSDRGGPPGAPPGRPGPPGVDLGPDGPVGPPHPPEGPPRARRPGRGPRPEGPPGPPDDSPGPPREHAEGRPDGPPDGPPPGRGEGRRGEGPEREPEVCRLSDGWKKWAGAYRKWGGSSKNCVAACVVSSKTTAMRTVETIADGDKTAAITSIEPGSRSVRGSARSLLPAGYFAAPCLAASAGASRVASDRHSSRCSAQARLSSPTTNGFWLARLFDSARSAPMSYSSQGASSPELTSFQLPTRIARFREWNHHRYSWITLLSRVMCRSG